MIKKTVLYLIVILMLLTGTGALAETERGDLAARFGQEEMLLYENVRYRQKPRMTNVLVMGVLKEEETGRYGAELMILLAINDADKSVRLIELDRMTPVKAALPAQSEEQALSNPEGGEAGQGIMEEVMLGAVMTEYDDAKLGCSATVEAVNGLLPAEVIEHYAAFDLEGIEVIDGIPGTENYMERIRTIAGGLEAMDSGDLNELFYELSDYIITDMKSGKMMKVIDKTDRYDRTATVHFRTAGNMPEDNPALTLMTEEALLDLAVQVFFEESIW